VDTGRGESGLTEVIFEKIRRMAAEVLDVPLDTLTADSSADTVESWDSVQHLNLILEVEQNFGVQADLEHMDQLQSLGAIAEWVSRRSQSV
jgi:acyl carrier protein